MNQAVLQAVVGWSVLALGAFWAYGIAKLVLASIVDAIRGGCERTASNEVSAQARMAKAAERVTKLRIREERRLERRAEQQRRRSERAARRARARRQIASAAGGLLEATGGATLWVVRGLARLIVVGARDLWVPIRVRITTWNAQAPVRAYTRAWRRVERPRRVKPTHAVRRIHAMDRLGMEVVRRSTFRGDVPRWATTYRLKDQGQWETATLVREGDQLYWLPGDPQEDPQLEGFLVDRKGLPQLVTIH